MRAMTGTVVVGVSLLAVSLSVRPVASSPKQGVAPTAKCVSIGKPKPDVTYTYDHIETTGKRSQYSNVWESVTDTGSRVRVVGPLGTQVQVNVHRIVDDVAVLSKTTKLDARGGVIDSTSFGPGLVSDPAFRVCEGKSWPIPTVLATYQSAQQNAATNTPPGTLRIVAIHESLTVPAGQFDTVHYIRTSQSVDEYWKALDLGVIAKHIATLPQIGSATETLVSTK